MYNIHEIPQSECRQVRYATIEEANAFILDTVWNPIELVDGQIISPFIRVWRDITNSKQPFVVDVALAKIGLGQ